VGQRSKLSPLPLEKQPFSASLIALYRNVQLERIRSDFNPALAFALHNPQAVTTAQVIMTFTGNILSG
jgi:hypothetical protein